MHSHCRSWVTRVILSALQRRPLFTQVQTLRCIALSDTQGQQQTHALQQSRGGFEIGCQACSSSSKALASFKSTVSKPSVNQP
jgi:hypothetical protein